MKSEVVMGVFGRVLKRSRNGFWSRWYREMALSISFPTLFALVVNKDDLGMEGASSPQFIRLINDWELEDLERFLTVLQGKKVRGRRWGEEDAPTMKRLKMVPFLSKTKDVPAIPLPFHHNLRILESHPRWVLLLGKRLGGGF